jgi:hypothetical protein
VRGERSAWGRAERKASRTTTWVALKVEVRVRVRVIRSVSGLFCKSFGFFFFLVGINLDRTVIPLSFEGFGGHGNDVRKAIF